MSSNESPRVPLPDQVSTLYKRLADVSGVLNASTDEFSKAIAPLEKGLQSLNLGIECWVPVKTYGGEDGDFERHELGYARIDGTWGIALRVVEGNERWAEAHTQSWLFNNGPRADRLDAIEKLPELLERLIKKADSMTKKIKESTQQAREVGSAISRAASEIGKGTIPVTPKKTGDAK
jgi:hypothetical protein